MAILHGSWSLQGHLFLWGKTWRRTEPMELATLTKVEAHPFGMTPAELQTFLLSLQQGGQWSGTLPLSEVKGQSQTLALPTLLTATTLGPDPTYGGDPDQGDLPEAALYLYPWHLTGIWLAPAQAIAFLRSLPLTAVHQEGNAFFGDDLRFWSHVARWSLDLLARVKVLPTLEAQPEAHGAGTGFEAGWQSLLDSAADQSRLQHFARTMPLVCRMYQEPGDEVLVEERPAGDMPAERLTVGLPAAPRDLIENFLKAVIGEQLRTIVRQRWPMTLQTVWREGAKGNATSPVRGLLESWLDSLGTGAALALDVDRLKGSLEAWTAPLLLHRKQHQAFRTCLYLHPPLVGRTDWTVEYFLQSIEDAEFLVDTPTIWKNPVERLVHLGRTIYRPQETLLTGLGLASRLCPPIEPSLKNKRPQFCYLNPLQAYEFLKTTAWRLQDSGFGVVLPPSLANREGWANRLGLKIRAGHATLPKGNRLGLQTLLNFQWELSIGGQTLSKTDLDRLVAQKTPLVEINGEWVELRAQDVRAAQTFFANRKDKVALSLQDVLRIGTGDTQVVEKLPIVGFDAGPLQELITTLTGGNQTIEPIPAPATLQGILRPYQARGSGWLAFLEQWGLGACLADDMGLGKSLETIAFLLHLKEKQLLTHPTLIVCPTSVLGNWEREIRKFSPSFTTLLHHGDKRAKGKAFNQAILGKDLIITSYALVARDTAELQSVPWQIVVLDEAQNIKNSEAKQSQAVRLLPAQFRIALTGTPVENRLAELWAILDFLNPGYLGPKNFFQRRFAIPIEKYGDTASLQTLRSLVQPFILRRLKTDRSIIQDLPDKQEMTVFCGLSAEQGALYQKVVEQSMAEIESSEGIQQRGLILGLLVKLKQICNHPAHYLKEKTLGHHHSGKLQRLEEMLDEVYRVDDRALIFTQFSEWGKLLQAHLQHKLGQEVLFLYGSVARKQREEMVDRFQHDPQGPRLLILSLKAGGTGLNLTRANHVFHFDRWWNPAVENQATDRAFRIGQTRNVQVHKFVCNGTLEERIHDLIESKKALADQVVGGGEQWLAEMDLKQLRELLVLDRGAVIDVDGD